MIDDFDLMQITEPLQNWFDTHARVLPWRDQPSAYYVWISEIMLQQTRVEAVKPYFERFIRTFGRGWDITIGCGTRMPRRSRLWMNTVG